METALETFMNQFTAQLTNPLAESLNRLNANLAYADRQQGTRQDAMMSALESLKARRVDMSPAPASSSSNAPPRAGPSAAAADVIFSQSDTKFDSLDKPLRVLATAVRDNFF